MKIIIECVNCEDGIVYPPDPSEGCSSCHECEGQGQMSIPMKGYETLEDVREDYPTAVIEP